VHSVSDSLQQLDDLLMDPYHATDNGRRDDAYQSRGQVAFFYAE
jgi:hypothetical protein